MGMIRGFNNLLTSKTISKGYILRQAGPSPDTNREEKTIIPFLYPEKNWKNYHVLAMLGK